MRFNRCLATNAQDTNSLFEKVKLLPVHLKFINSTFPRQNMFQNDNSLLLSLLGVTLFKQAVFSLAGFVKKCIVVVFHD